ncbi:MAG: hypothetical protein WCS01_12155, partial [bacterium]
YTRPQIALYGIPLIVAFLAKVRSRHGVRTARRRGLVLGLGAFVGYLPMLVHSVFRAGDWPFHHHVHTKLGLLKVGETFVRFFELVGGGYSGCPATAPFFRRCPWSGWRRPCWPLYSPGVETGRNRVR